MYMIHRGNSLSVTQRARHEELNRIQQFAANNWYDNEAQTL
jgi:hypothetical protein